MLVKRIFPLVFAALLFGCNNDEVTNKNDYSAYLSTEINQKELMADVDFWTQKLEATPGQFPYLAKRAGAHSSVFDTTGDISHLIAAEKDLIAANEATEYNNAGYLKALASNYISQHKFKEALTLLKKAEENGEKLQGTKKMLFDAHLELGNYIYAKSYLDEFKNTSDFDYLIRLAKWEDHQGNLDAAIQNMEKATAIAESSNLKPTKVWAYSNLADFYGHDGQIKKSYDYYLKTLELDPDNAYAKKGIAWIVYSYEKNPKDALAILEHINTYYYAPDYDLLKADIADYMGDQTLKSKSLESYRNHVENEHYGDMYNKYNVLLYTDAMINVDEALAIAQKEVNNRPTPESYDLLAWSVYKKGDAKKALEILEKNVIGYTSEPDVLYHIAEIYKANGIKDKVAPIKEELLSSLYELGPTMDSQIKAL